MRSCEYGNCTFPVFGTDKNTGIGYCKSHQGHRTDKKVKKIPVRSERKPVFDLSFGFESQSEMFEMLWQNAQDASGRVVCPYTKEHLNKYRNTNMFFSCFAHILCKKNWTYFKMNPENVAVVSPMFHAICDCGTLAQRKEHPDWKWDIWDKKVIEMKEQYQIFKRKNLLS